MTPVMATVRNAGCSRHDGVVKSRSGGDACLSDTGLSRRRTGGSVTPEPHNPQGCKGTNGTWRAGRVPGPGAG